LSAKIVALAYDQPDTADRALERIRQLEGADQLALDDAAVVVRDRGGDITHRSLGEDTERRVQGGAIGALTGTLVGMLFGPVGAVVGLLGGGAVGAAKWHDVEIHDTFIEELARGLAPGTSAIIVLGDEDELAFLASRVPDELRGRLISTDFDDEQLRRLRESAA
jgi:uncharacterized membrane protein